MTYLSYVILYTSKNTLSILIMNNNGDNPKPWLNIFFYPMLNISFTSPSDTCFLCSNQLFMPTKNVTLFTLYPKLITRSIFFSFWNTLSQHPWKLRKNSLLIKSLLVELSYHRSSVCMASINFKPYISSF